MKSFGPKLIVIVIIAVLLLIFNPGLKKHQDKIIQKYKQENPITGAFGAGEIVSKAISYKNYYFFSIGKISLTNKSVSFGIAGFVIVYGTMDLLDYKDKVMDLTK